MPNNWKTYNIGDIDEIQIIDGDRGKHYPKRNEFNNEGFCLFLSAKNVTKSGFEFDELSFISKEKDNLLRKGKLNKKDIVLTTRGTVGNIGYFKDSIGFKDVRINSGMVVIRANEKCVDSSYLYQFLKSSIFQFQVASRVSGSAQPQLPIRDLNFIEINLPPLPEQKAIANILSAIDDKIENNLAINNTLEDMAMALYKHWFVDFGPFEDIELIESEIFGNNETIKIPKSFKIISVKDSIIRLKQKNKYNQKNVLEKGIIRVFDQSTDRILGFHNNKPDFNADFENPILIFGDHTCRFEIVCEDFSVGPNLIPFKPNDATYNFIMYLGLKEKVKTNDYKRHWSELMLHQLIVPKDNKILNRFNNTIKENYRLINENEFENLYLSQLRDTLLPKFISGEVRLSEFKEQIETVL